MATDNPTDSSIPAWAEFSGVMIIDTVTAAAGKPKTLYITGAFYTGMDPVMGAFKYFNKYDHVIEPENRYFVHTTVRSYCIFLVSYS
jgi:hypothetical protein